MGFGFEVQGLEQEGGIGLECCTVMQVAGFGFKSSNGCKALRLKGLVARTGCRVRFRFMFRVYGGEVLHSRNPRLDPS